MVFVCSNYKQSTHYTKKKTKNKKKEKKKIKKRPCIKK